MNKIFKRCIVFFVVSVVFSGVVMGGISAQERAALIALYNSTNGDSWYQNSGWKTAPLAADGFAQSGTEGNWCGVTVSGDHVAEIYLYQNNLKGTIPSELGNLSNLKELWLFYNSLSGNIPKELGNLSQLQELHLHNNKLSGIIPAELGNLTQLEYLELRANELEGSIPSQLGNLGNLEYLFLDGNRLTGNIPAPLGNLGHLKEFSLNGNFLSGTIPASLGNLENVVELYLSSNKLSGTIPAELGNLAKLELLDLSTNSLSGSIPSQLGNLSQLRDLFLAYNTLSGNIPPELANLTQLRDINLSNNRLSGNIPAQLGNLSQLVQLDLSYNTLGGSLPSTLGNLNLLKYLILSHNKLIGPIPASFLTLPALYLVAVYENCLIITEQEVRIWLVNHYAASWEDQNQCGGTVSELNPPFGFFDSPVEGAAVSGSIAVTGWALDDSGVESVKIYLNMGNTQLYIGDALFVEGARPDVNAMYPSYPFHSRAGWGYMLLTNFLPQQGNGVFVLSAVATDSVGKTTTLGTKTIHVDNAHAVKPFGAIDTPIQGGIAAGSSFVNWGWVLTPQPNSIPTNGSTIDVWVDGVNLGHPVYNVYRTDIATLFPGYANSNGAVGHFTLNTTPYQNGVHTIQWTARDNGGNSDGIGSRYFTIQNAVPDNTQETYSAAIKRDITEIAQFPEEFSEAITFKKGFKSKGNGEELLPDETGKNQLQIKELERVEIQLGKSYADIEGYLVYNNELNNLPIGSTLDTESGTFSWSPGPGFLGKYSLVFVLTDTNGLCSKKEIDIIIKSKHNRLN